MRARTGSVIKNVYTLGIAARKAEPRLCNQGREILEVRCFCDCSMLECRSCVSARERYGGGGGEPSNIDPALQVDSENSGGLAMRV